MLKLQGLGWSKPLGDFILLYALSLLSLSPNVLWLCHTSILWARQLWQCCEPQSLGHGLPAGITEIYSWGFAVRPPPIRKGTLPTAQPTLLWAHLTLCDFSSYPIALKSPLLRLLKPKAKAGSVLKNLFFPIGYILQRAWLWKRKGDEAGGNKNINIFKKSRTPKKNLRTALSRVSSLPSTHRRWQFLSPTIAGIFYLRSAVAVSSWGQRKCLQVQICICREFHDWLYYRGEVGWG